MTFATLSFVDERQVLTVI
jgi:hypothetical protein